MNYSICFKDAFGCTGRSEFTPFDDDAAATTYAADNLPGNAMIEVWNGEHLISRLFGDRTLAAKKQSSENKAGAVAPALPLRR